MGKKGKTKKNRLDKFYHLAKEQGFRARSAFKLIQIAQKFNFFPDCNCLLDLCAAPGGWLQVARKYLSDEKIIIGVDLAPIKPIRKVITIQADIKTIQCKKVIEDILKEIKCDVVLHDGSPNMGADWTHDAYNQNELVLHSLKLATHFLKAKGVFVTKIFRSQHYHSVYWVLQQLFGSVNVIKPSASRDVSAELYLVCLGYKAPQKIDPKFFSPQSVFADIEVKEKSGSNKRSLKELLLESNRVHRQGYNDTVLYSVAPVQKFFSDTIKPAEFLVSLNKLSFDRSTDNLKRHKTHKTDEEFRDDDFLDKILSNPLTTQEIKDYCADLKVLGVRELSMLIKWRAKLLRQFSKQQLEESGINNDTEFSKNDEDNKDLLENHEEQFQQNLIELIEKDKKQKLKEKRKERALLKKRQMLKEKSFSAFGHVLEDSELFQKDLAEKAFQFEEEVLDKVYKEHESEDEDLGIKVPELELDEEEKRLKQMEEDLEIANEVSKEKERAARLKRELKKEKQTRRQKAYMNMHQQIAAASEAVTLNQNELNQVSKSDDDDDVSSASEFHVPEVEDIISYKSEDSDSTDENLTEKRKKCHKSVSQREESDTKSRSSDANSEGLQFESDEESSASSDVTDDESEDIDDEFEVSGDQVTRLKDDQAENSDSDFDISDKQIELQVKKALKIRKKVEKEIIHDENETDSEIEISKVEDSDVDSVINDPWLQQPIFKEAGIDPSQIIEPKEEYLPAIPMTDKKLRNLKKKAKAEKEMKKRSKDMAADFEDDNKPFVEVPRETDESEVHIEAPKNVNELKKMHALGSILARKRLRKDLIDGAYNRYAFDDDECVPEWFLEEESKFSRPELPITKELMQEYRRKLREIAKTPIRKIREAVGRKKMRLKTRLDSIRKKAAPIMDSKELSEKGKAAHINKLMRKARKKEGPLEKSYVVAGKSGKSRAARKTSEYGKVKFVDKRLKKDKRGMKAKLRRQRRH